MNQFFSFFFHTYEDGPFMGGAWSVRVYEEGFAHPVGDFYGDFSKVLSFPDAKNTTFKIDGVQFMLPNLGSTSSNVFQISFTAQDFQHATYFCVDIYYNLDTGKMTTTKNVEASLLTSLMTVDAPQSSTVCKEDKDCPCSYCQNDPTKHAPFHVSFTFHPFMSTTLCCTSTDIFLHSLIFSLYFSNSATVHLLATVHVAPTPIVPIRPIA